MYEKRLMYEICVSCGGIGTEDCSFCGGSGTEDCAHCNGSGMV